MSGTSSVSPSRSLSPSQTPSPLTLSGSPSQSQTATLTHSVPPVPGPYVWWYEIQTVVWGLSAPKAISVDGAAGFYIAEFGGPYVRWADWATTYTRHVACTYGQYGVGGDGGPAQSAICGSPDGVLSDGAGGVYFSDFATSSVRHVWANGTVTSFLGVESYNTNNAYSGDGGPATLATINSPAHLTGDCAGAVYVANRANHNVLRVRDGVVVSVAGTPNVAGYAGDFGPASSALLNNPNGVEFDCVTGRLYIADTYNSVIRAVLPE